MIPKMWMGRRIFMNPKITPPSVRVQDFRGPARGTDPVAEGLFRMIPNGHCPLDWGGNSHHNLIGMLTTTERKKPKAAPTIVAQYDVAADAKKRISLRHAKTKYFHVKALSNGAYLLEPRVLAPPGAVSARVMRMLDQSAANLKKGFASPSVDLTPFLPD